MPETKSITGKVINIENTGEYKGNKKWRVHLQPEGSDGTFLLDIMDNKANNNPGTCPAVVGEMMYAEYTDKGWDSSRGEHITFHNYYWPFKSNTSGGPNRSSGGSVQDKVTMTISKDIEGTVFTVAASVASSNTQDGARMVNKAFNDLFMARKNMNSTPEKPPEAPDNGINEEIPPF